jgi:hypothetical protein
MDSDSDWDNDTISANLPIYTPSLFDVFVRQVCLGNFSDISSSKFLLKCLQFDELDNSETVELFVLHSSGKVYTNDSTLRSDSKRLCIWCKGFNDPLYSDYINKYRRCYVDANIKQYFVEIYNNSEIIESKREFFCVRCDDTLYDITNIHDMNVDDIFNEEEEGTIDHSKCYCNDCKYTYDSLWHYNLDKYGCINLDELNFVNTKKL